MNTPNCVCLKCGKPYPAQPGSVIAGLCPVCVRQVLDRNKAWGQIDGRGAVADLSAR